jgi:hypothetical protein
MALFLPQSLGCEYKTNSKSPDRPFITTHSGRWRFAQVIMISVFGQWSGNGLGYFNSTIFNILGYTSSSTQLLLNIVNSIVSAVGAGTAVCLTDKMPRRPVLIFGTLGEFISTESTSYLIIQLM